MAEPVAKECMHEPHCRIMGIHKISDAGFVLLLMLSNVD